MLDATLPARSSWRSNSLQINNFHREFLESWKAKNARLGPFRALRKGEMALSRKNSCEIFSEPASLEGKKALDSRLVGLILLAALLWVLGDLGP